MEDYTVTVKFFRSGSDDHPFLEERMQKGQALDEAKANQLAAELQEAYDVPDCSIAGTFKVVEVDGKPFTPLEERKKELKSQIVGLVESLSVKQLKRLADQAALFKVEG